METPTLLAITGDSALEQALVRLVAEAINDCELTVASSVQEGLAQLSIAPADALVIDSSTANKASAQLCRQLSDDRATANLPILVLADAEMSPADRAGVLESGANDCISWPADEIELAARLRLLLRTSQAVQLRYRLIDPLTRAQQLEMIGEIAGAVAHDFNNALTAIIGSTDLVGMAVPEQDKQGRMAISAIEQATEQAASLTRFLLTFTRTSRVQKTRVDLNHVINDVTRFARRLLPSGIVVETSVDNETPVWVYADQLQLQQVVMNLALNARDAMSGGGTLRIHVAPPSPDAAPDDCENDLTANCARVTVSDTGDGINLKTQAQVFRPLFTTKPHGTGLGLTAIQRIVADHDGQIELRSDAGAGSTFTIFLPTAAHTEATYTQNHLAPPRGKGELVLLAEDHETTLSVMRTNLEKLGYATIVTNTGRDVLAEAQRNLQRLRLIVLDLDLPTRDGLGCLRDLRATGLQVPVVLITGQADASLREDLGKDTHFLRKPFSSAQFGHVVARALGGSDRNGTAAPSSSVSTRQS